MGSGHPRREIEVAAHEPAAPQLNPAAPSPHYRTLCKRLTWQSRFVPWPQSRAGIMTSWSSAASCMHWYRTPASSSFDFWLFWLGRFRSARRYGPHNASGVSPSIFLSRHVSCRSWLHCRTTVAINFATTLVPSSLFGNSNTRIAVHDALMTGDLFESD